ncbi:hypothetical protein ANCDUO_00022 [Ancylostoma duodenale]|uniref:Uncharacterized protein n=1 Tax=Ancylostoma duodenale TaxID=51022 RepID=A0A0C2HJ78_9BILA|nr:hypothetical protein ANCDUO_00022 [Ancylostoma duodenale]
MEAELAASRSNVNIANRGNSMFAEFAEERVRLEADMKALFSKYEAVRKQNYQLSNELDEARLLALRRTRREVSGSFSLKMFQNFEELDSQLKRY